LVSGLRYPARGIVNEQFEGGTRGVRIQRMQGLHHTDHIDAYRGPRVDDQLLRKTQDRHGNQLHQDV
jgi:hypothetical protein